MTAKGLSEEVKKFITEHINSFEQLEGLLLLHSHPQQEWTAQEVSQELRLSQASAAMRLVAREASEPLYRYHPQKPDFEPTVDSLAKLYPDYRFTVINLIFSKPLDKAVPRFKSSNCSHRLDA